MLTDDLFEWSHFWLGLDSFIGLARAALYL